MKTVILAGGLGTRLSEYTHEVPKPMVPIGGIPILVHVMSIYAKYGHKEFIVATGYKSEIINDFFIKNSKKILLNEEIKKIFEFSSSINGTLDYWVVTLIYTGDNTMTGGRVKKVESEIDSADFMMTYGDGISDVNINELIKFHKEKSKLATLTAVRPPVRFGELEITGNQITKFAEKPRLQKGWINGGFFIINKKVIDLIEGDDTMFEREPLEKVVEMNELMAFKHDSFWQCMDTKRDKDILEEMWLSNKSPWLK